MVSRFTILVHSNHAQIKKIDLIGIRNVNFVRVNKLQFQNLHSKRLKRFFYRWSHSSLYKIILQWCVQVLNYAPEISINGSLQTTNYNVKICSSKYCCRRGYILLILYITYTSRWVWCVAVCERGCKMLEKHKNFP